MGRNSCCVKQKLRKGLWSPEEDEKLYNYITRFGVGCWSSVAKLAGYENGVVFMAGLQRCGKSCRLRWINYLRPDLKRGMFSQEEEDLIMSLHKALGNRWARIAAQLPGRTDNEIKNFWNSSLKKKLIKQGIDPNTHKPINETEVEDDQKDCTDSSKGLPILATSSSQIEPQTYNFASKQVYDPLFLPEFQANLDPPDYYQSNFLSHNLGRPYEQNQVEDSFVIPTCGFNSMPDLAHFDHQNMMDSRMNKDVMNEGSSTFFWDGENKMDSMFEFQFSGIQIEERRQCSLWQEGTKKFDHQEDFSDYPLTTLSQELIGANLDVFQQI